MGDSSRRRLPPGTTVCYLCDQPIADNPKIWNHDHVPPRRWFGQSIRRQVALQLPTLCTHMVCNSAYREDEEYFFVCLVLFAEGTIAGDAVFRDFRRQLKERRWQGLVRHVRSHFGKIEVEPGRVGFFWDHLRTGRVMWKLVRGVHFRLTGQVLPENFSARELDFFTPFDGDRYSAHTWLPALDETLCLTPYGAIFAVRAFCLIDLSTGLRGHLYSFRIWNRIVMSAMFHDGTCACEDCLTRRRSGK